MRLRRETGDFQIVATMDSENNKVFNSIRKGLSAEDFVGEVVNYDGILNVITYVTTNPVDGLIMLVFFDLGGLPIELTYDPATGVIAEVSDEEDTDDTPSPDKS